LIDCPSDGGQGGADDPLSGTDAAVDAAKETADQESRAEDAVMRAPVPDIPGEASAAATAAGSTATATAAGSTAAGSTATATAAGSTATAAADTDDPRFAARGDHQLRCVICKHFVRAAKANGGHLDCAKASANLKVRAACTDFWARFSAVVRRDATVAPAFCVCANVGHCDVRKGAGASDEGCPGVNAGTEAEAAKAKADAAKK
jgi:hypothetical protein